MNYNNNLKINYNSFFIDMNFHNLFINISKFISLKYYKIIMQCFNLIYKIIKY